MGMRSVANFQSLFPPYNSPISTSRPRPAKRQRNESGRSSWMPPRETWTHEFMCLADKDTNEIPSRAKKFDLQENGLGRKRVVFNMPDDPFQFNNKLLESYAKLKDTGGYEFLRSGASPKTLMVIAPPPVVTMSNSYTMTPMAVRLSEAKERVEAKYIFKAIHLMGRGTQKSNV
ncbi:hypothetical protein AWC38_SpisGene18743 [Stylophora pistillata]|uniref:Uncharacterized protein n=1 Tax=Stylophora pistillata TaxID=50429 RepID=A0A2B4RKR6_STYPI|nr:hypothetical protein AWC38_SpisGene18743 [Stylophora pistillata]